jgi:hypothetical protein
MCTYMECIGTNIMGMRSMGEGGNTLIIIYCRSNFLYPESTNILMYRTKRLYLKILYNHVISSLLNGTEIDRL